MYEQYMEECFELAKQGKTSPNPMVGCVVLDKDGNKISTGYHRKYGCAHAERDALLKITKEQACGGTLIVNLEPCSHFGKTPPCADLIIEYGIKKLVVAMVDPNPIVSGQGIEKCKDAGIEVVLGVLEDEAKILNEVFIKNVVFNKPFVAIKTATTLDGKIATQSGSSKWITSETARSEVLKIREIYDAILTTSTTVLVDNPTMNHDVKIILDRELKTKFSSNIYKNQESKIFVITAIDVAHSVNNIDFIKIPVINNRLDLEFALVQLYERGIRSVLIEAGGELNGYAIKNNLVDKIYHFIAPKITCDNLSHSCFSGFLIDEISQSLNFKISSVEHFEPDILITYYPEN